jgi:hypothetical protein
MFSPLSVFYGASTKRLMTGGNGEYHWTFAAGLMQSKFHITLLMFSAIYIFLHKQNYAKQDF